MYLRLNHIHLLIVNKRDINYKYLICMRIDKKKLYKLFSFTVIYDLISTSLLLTILAFIVTFINSTNKFRVIIYVN